MSLYSVPVTSSPPLWRTIIARHWRGEFSLAISVWVVGLPVGILQTGFGYLFRDDTALVLAPAIQLTILLFSLLLFNIHAVWHGVGVWRSAGRSIRVFGTRFWPTAARTAVWVGSCVTGASVAYFVPPALSAAVEAARDFPSMPPSGVRVLRDGTEIEISGFFRWNLVAQFQDALDKAPNARTVHLHSEGGLHTAALKIRDTIAQRRMDTYVSTFCASACTIAFLAGQRRWILLDAKMAFHRGHVGGRDDIQINHGVRRSYEQAGLREDFIKKILATPSNSAWFPPIEALRAEGVITDIADLGHFAVSGFGPKPTLASVTETLRKIAPLNALAEVSPKDFDHIAHNWLVAVELAGTGTIARRDTKERLRAVLLRSLSRMPDNAVLALAEFAAGLVHRLRRLPPTECAAALRDMWFGSRQVPPTLQQPESLAALVALRATAEHPVTATNETASITARAILTRLTRRNTLEGATLQAILTAQPSDPRFCAAWHQVLEEAMAQPKPQAAATLRLFLGLRW